MTTLCMMMKTKQIILPSTFTWSLIWTLRAKGQICWKIKLGKPLQNMTRLNIVFYCLSYRLKMLSTVLKQQRMGKHQVQVKSEMQYRSKSQKTPFSEYRRLCKAAGNKASSLTFGRRHTLWTWRNLMCVPQIWCHIVLTSLLSSLEKILEKSILSKLKVIVMTKTSLPNSSLGSGWRSFVTFTSGDTRKILLLHLILGS